MQSQPNVVIYAILFVAAFFATLALTPLSIRLAHKVGAIDHPSERKIHDFPIPRLGGLAVAAAVALTLLLGCYLNPYLRGGLFSLKGLLAGSFIILALGIYDDIRNAPPLLKILVQAGGAGLAVALGIRFDLVSNPLAPQMRDHFNLGILAIPLAILWIVVLTNAMNLIDGLDGLATGIALFASTAMFLISLSQGAGVVTYFYASLAGSTLAFLKFNRFPARVFLGDAGSTFLGFCFACLSIEGSQKSYTITALFIPLIVFGLPIFDAIVALIRRYINRTKFQVADGEHIHHQLVSFGLHQRQAVFILYAVTIMLGIVGFSFTVLLDEYAAVILVIIGLLGGFMAKELNVFGQRRRAMERNIKHVEKSPNP